MPRYLVESYSAGSGAAVAHAEERAQQAAELGSGVCYLRTTFLPGDETVLHWFEAPSTEALAEAAKRAGLPYERITEAVEGPALQERQTSRDVA